MSRATQWPNWMQVTGSKYPSTQRLCGPVDGNTSPLSSKLELPFRFLLLPSDDFKSACFFQMEFSQWFSTIFPACPGPESGRLRDPSQVPSDHRECASQDMPWKIPGPKAAAQRNTHDQTVLVGDNLGETPKVGFNTVLSLIVKFRMASPLQSSDVFNWPCWTWRHVTRLYHVIPGYQIWDDSWYPPFISP
jgi:hypothetical protein